MKLLIFQGGGYDGCIWEWNALIFEDGKLVESCTSGRVGARIQATVEQLGTFRGVRQAIRDESDSRRPQSSPFIIRTDAQWDQFCREWNSGFVRVIAKAAGRDVRCDNCGQYFDPEEILHTGYKGDGGIGVQFTDNKCRDCADAEHADYVAELWHTLPIKNRVNAIRNARMEGIDVSLFAARRAAFPEIPAECVYEPEYY